MSLKVLPASWTWMPGSGVPRMSVTVSAMPLRAAAVDARPLAAGFAAVVGCEPRAAGGVCVAGGVCAAGGACVGFAPVAGDGVGVDAGSVGCVGRAPVAGVAGVVAAGGVWAAVRLEVPASNKLSSRKLRMPALQRRMRRATSEAQSGIGRAVYSSSVVHKPPGASRDAHGIETDPWNLPAAALARTGGISSSRRRGGGNRLKPAEGERRSFRRSPPVIT